MKDLPCVCPAVAAGMNSIEGMCILVHSSATVSYSAVESGQIEGSQAGLSARLFDSWLREYWAACYSEDLAPLRDMLDYTSEYKLIPLVPPSLC